jgi:hypothetical protein
MALVTLHRTAERRHLTVPLRVERLEEDADINEELMVAIDKKLNTLNARAMGLLISLVVASIMLAANLVVR